MSAPRDGRRENFVAGNYFDKYRSHNPLHRLLMKGFLDCARQLVAMTHPSRILEVGCAAGDLGSLLFHSDVEYTGIDLGAAEIALARSHYPTLSFVTGTAYELPFSDDSFDLVVMCEVLEHLVRPQEAIAEAVRVTRSHILVSVPWEPVWRVMNLLRGKYWRQLGNTPGHLQHFSRRGMRRLLTLDLRHVAERRPFPWAMFLIAKELRNARII
jgi:2-polyprenyl-3-methyl-5-hydroxy-6-metoxy-1,4-benzoquinol methylase